jgi:hypothetical protein
MTQYTTLSEELNKLPRERQELIEIRASQIHLEEIGSPKKERTHTELKNRCNDE